MPRKQRRSTKAKAAAVDVKAPGRGEGPGGAGTPGRSRPSGTSRTSESKKVGLTSPPCTCHPDDRPPGPCPGKYAASECQKAARATTPAKHFTTDESVDAFMEAVVEHDGIKPASRAFGLGEGAVFYWASTHDEFRLKLNAAMGAVLEKQAHELNELCDQLLKMDPDDRMKSANAYGKVIETRMRMLGKLLPKIYGEKPQTQVNFNNNTALIVDEESRMRLIELQRKLLSNGGAEKPAQVIEVSPQKQEQ